MALALNQLMKALDVKPALAAGHSAGAAILARMSLDGYIAPAALMSLNGALLGLRGLPRHIFSPIAKVMASCPAVSYLFAWRAADPALVKRMLRDTGSTLDAKGIELYSRLAAKPGPCRRSARDDGKLGFGTTRTPAAAPQAAIVFGCHR